MEREKRGRQSTESHRLGGRREEDKVPKLTDWEGEETKTDIIIMMVIIILIIIIIILIIIKRTFFLCDRHTPAYTCVYNIHV